MFLDTETGSDWVKPRFDAENIELYTAKTRSFTDLMTAVKEAEASGSFLIVDSITHFWTSLCDEYEKRRQRKYGLQFQDWAWLKQQWRKFTDLFVNSNCHIIICGRAGYEYDFFENESGKKELEKTGVKMKAENETGYEPSILILMQKEMDIDTKKVLRKATILKDRSTKIDGKEFINPTFKDFFPHIDFLNLGGQQLGVDTTRDNAELFSEDGEPKWQKDARLKSIALEEIKEVLSKHYPSRSADDQKLKGDMLEYAFNTRAWARIETFDYPSIGAGRNALWLKLEGVAYEFVKPMEADAYKEAAKRTEEREKEAQIN